MARYLMNSLYENQNDLFVHTYDNIVPRDSEEGYLEDDKSRSVFSKSDKFLHDCPIKIGL